MTMLRDQPIMILHNVPASVEPPPLACCGRGPREKDGAEGPAPRVPLKRFRFQPFNSDFRSGTMRTEYLQVAQPRPEAWPFAGCSATNEPPIDAPVDPKRPTIVVAPSRIPATSTTYISPPREIVEFSAEDQHATAIATAANAM